MKKLQRYRKLYIRPDRFFVDRPEPYPDITDIENYPVFLLSPRITEFTKILPWRLYTKIFLIPPLWNSVHLFFNLPAAARPGNYQNTASADIDSWFKTAGPVTLSDFQREYWRALSYNQFYFNTVAPKDDGGNYIIPTLTPTGNDPKKWEDLINKYLDVQAENVWKAAGSLTDGSIRVIPSVVLIQNYPAHATATFGPYDRTVSGTTYRIMDKTHVVLSSDPSAVDSNVIGGWSTLTHEHAHNFLEGPDLYGGGSGRVGYWDILGDASPGGRMSETISFFKHRLDWLDYKETIEGPDYNQRHFILQPYSQENEAVKVIPDPVNNPTEYFLLENRSAPAGASTWTPGGNPREEGLIIVHANERMGTGVHTLASASQFLAVEEADGNRSRFYNDSIDRRHGDIKLGNQSFIPSGPKNELAAQAGNNWPGSQRNIGILYPFAYKNSFTPSTWPNSNFYGRRPSGLFIENIQKNGSNIEFDLRIAGNSIVGWLLNPNDRIVTGRFTGQEDEEIFIRNADSAALLKVAENQWLVSKYHRDWIGEWNLGPYDRELVGDFDGDGLDEIYIRSHDWAGIIKWKDDEFITVTVQGGWIDDWNLGSDNWEVVGDFDGDGQDEIYVRSPEWAGVFKLVNGSLELQDIQHDWIGEWNLGSDNREITGDFDGDGKDEICIRSPVWIGLLSFTGGKLKLDSIQNNTVGNWNLNWNDTETAGDFNGDSKDELFLQREDKVALLAFQSGNFVATWQRTGDIDSHPEGGGTYNASNIDYPPIAGKFTSHTKDSLLVRSNRSVAILLESAGTIKTLLIRDNQLGGWHFAAEDQWIGGPVNRNGQNDFFILRVPEQYTFLTFANDADAGQATNVFYRDIKLREDKPVLLDAANIERYGGSRQDKTPTGFSVLDEGLVLKLSGNTWKAFPFPVQLDAESILEFEYRSLNDMPEISGIGFDTHRGSITASRHFNIFGSQNWGIQDLKTYTGSSWKTLRIPVGQFFTGNFQYITFSCDADAEQNTNIFFKNIRVTTVKSVLFDTSALQSYGGSGQDINSSQFEVLDNARTLRLWGNNWKAMPVSIQMGPGTVLEFDFRSTGAEGEINAVGLDSQTARLHADKYFQIGGTQTNGLQDIHGETSTAWQHFTIPLGERLIKAGHFSIYHNTGKNTFGWAHLWRDSGTILHNAPEARVDFNLYDIESYGGAGQDRTPHNFEILDSGRMLHLWKNTWKAIRRTVMVYASTILELEILVQDDLPEVLGIGIDNQTGSITAGKHFKLAGTQAWGITEYSGSAGNWWRHIEIPIGQHLTGWFEYLTFSCDADAGQETSIYFRNIRFSDQQDPLDLRQGVVSSYGGSQDFHPGNFEVVDFGRAIRLYGNAWKALSIPATIVPDTILELDYFSFGEAPEVSGIGFDDQLAQLSQHSHFKIFGTQAWGIQDFQKHTGGRWHHIKIPVGEYLRGDFQYLTFSCDADAGQQVDVVFRNVRIHDQSHESFLEGSFSSYGRDDQDKDPAQFEIQDNGRTLRLWGNNWKALSRHVPIHPNTILKFDFKNDGDPAEINAIGLDSQEKESRSQRYFQIFGTQNDGFQDYHNYTGSDWKSYEIAVGKKFGSTSFTHVTFANDADKGQATTIYYKNVTIWDKLWVDFSTATPVSYGGSGQDIDSANVQVLDSGATLRLWGNTWKAIPFPIELFPDSILEFEFKSEGDSGEVQGVGVDTQRSNISSSRHFNVAGTQNWGRREFYRSPENGKWRFVRIPIGLYISGNMQYLTFSSDADASQATNVFYRNIRITRRRLIDFNAASIVSYGGSGQDKDSANIQILDSGATLKLWGNNWKAFPLAVNGDIDTFIELDFRSTGIQAEINGVGLETQTGNLTTDRYMQIYGTQADGLRGNFLPYQNDGEWEHLKLPIGQYLFAAYYILFANDADAGQNTDVCFRDIRLTKGI